MATLSFDHNEIKGLVSVVIPTYRGERFIGEALDSVSSQTYLNWEIIVVEDGSYGASQEIVAKFAQRHPSKRVSYHRNEHNLGPSHTRNAAFRRVQGEFVALLDSDDRWLPDHLAISLQALQAHGSDIAYSTVLMIEDQTGLLVGVCGPQSQDLADFPHGLFRQNFITPSATVMRRVVLAEVGAWDIELRFCEDLDFWLRCVAAGKKFQHVTGWHCLYRKNHMEAATRKTCAVLEAFAHVVERYMRLPGTRKKTCRKYAYNAYVRAAEFHAHSDPMRDSSVDRSRIAGLLLHAWRLRPKHVECLWRGTVQSALNLFRRRNPPSTRPANKSELRAAA